jgi:hypothetical protein
MLQDGFVYELPMLARITTEIDGGCLPKGVRQVWQTPTVSCAEHPGQVKWKPHQQLRLTQQVNNPHLHPKMAMFATPNTVQYFPTPQASDNRDRGHMSNPSIIRRQEIGKQIGLSTFVKPDKASGSLNPQWVAWMMGWPMNHTLIGGNQSQTSEELPA